MKNRKKSFMIDFESWEIEAEDRGEAYREVFQRMMNGEFPEIVYLEVSRKPSLKVFDEIYVAQKPC